MDFDGLKNDPVRRDLYIIGTFERIRELRALPENKYRHIELEIDEIARFDEIPFATEMFKEFLEIGRKDGIWVTGLTNSLENIIESKSCVALWEHSSIKILLQQLKQVLEKVRERLGGYFTESDICILEDLEFKKHEFSDVFIIKENQRISLRYYTSPRELFLAPTNILSSQVVFTQLEKSKEPEKALLELERQFPDGKIKES